MNTGNMKACDTINAALRFHSATDANVATWACKSLVALSMFDVNKQRFVNSETCSCVIKALQVSQQSVVILSIKRYVITVNVLEIYQPICYCYCLLCC